MSFLEAGADMAEIEERIQNVRTNELIQVQNEIDTYLGRRVLRLIPLRFQAILACVDAYHPSTGRHEFRTAVRVKHGLPRIRSHAFTKKDAELCVAGALLHDVGKLAIDLAILDAPRQLSDEERRRIKNHPRYGVKICGGLMPELYPYIAGHHEQTLQVAHRYPRIVNRMPPRTIHEEWMVGFMARVDEYDALTDPERCYRTPLAHADAMHQVITDFGPGYEEALKACAMVPHDIRKSA